MHKKLVLSMQQKGVLATVTTAAMIASIMVSAVNLSVNSISNEFQQGITNVTWVVTIYTIIAAIVCVPLGHLGDTHNRKSIFLCSVVLFSLSSLGCTFAPTLECLIITRVLHSIAAGGINAVNTPMLIDAFPSSMRGRAIGYSISAVYLGLSLGPVIGGFVNLLFGWRYIFLISSLFSMVSFLLGWHYLTSESIHIKENHDILGNLLYMAMIAFIMLGFSIWNDSYCAKLLLIIGIILFSAFVAVEKRTRYPTVQISLFAHSAKYTFSNIAALLNYAATFAISYIMSIYLQNVLGLTSAIAGIILISQPTIQAFVSPLAGRLSDHIAPYKLASAGMATTSAGLFALSTINEQTSVLFIVCTLMIVGLGLGVFLSPNTNEALSCAGNNHIGEANAILATMRNLGMSISIVIIMQIFNTVIGNTLISSTPGTLLTDAIHVSMFVFAILCIIGTFVSFIKRKLNWRA